MIERVQNFKKAVCSRIVDFWKQAFQKIKYGLWGICLSMLSPNIRGNGSWPWKQSRRFIESTSSKILLQTEVAFLILPLKILCWMTLEENAMFSSLIYFLAKTYLLLRLDYFKNCLYIDECTWHFILLFIIQPQFRICVEFFLFSKWRFITMFMWYLNEKQSALFWILV